MSDSERSSGGSQHAETSAVGGLGTPAWLPFGLMGVAAVILGLSWDALPERWIMHWGPGGVPDGWATRSVPMVFGPLVMGVVVCLGLEGLGQLLVRMPMPGDERMMGPHKDAIARVMGRMSLTLMRSVTLGLGLLFSTLSLALPLLHPHKAGQVLMGSLVLVLGSVSLGAVRMVRMYRAAIASGEMPKIEGYNGLLYKNPKDSRLMVPKMTGYGMTFNFAHPLAWPVMGLVVGLPIAITLLSLIAM